MKRIMQILLAVSLLMILLYAINKSEHVVFFELEEPVTIEEGSVYRTRE